MWIFTTAGMLSVAEDPADSTRVLVRSRDKESIATAVSGIAVAYGEDLEDKILVDAGTDYKYRVSATKEDFANFLAHEVLNYITYPNFKGALQEARGATWGRAALNVWSAMWSIADD